jgi:hypothetical protein
MEAIAAAGRADEPRNGASENEIKRLIDQLGSDRFTEREQATDQLSKLGKSALQSLKEATKSPDLEVRHRAQRLVQQIEPPSVIPPTLVRPLLDRQPLSPDW